MKYEEFVAKVKEGIIRKRGEEVRIHISTVTKNNGGIAERICLLSERENVTPAIELEPFYQMACHGVALEEVADEILRCYENYRHREVLDTGCFTDYGRASERIVCRLIHYQKNQELLFRIPHIPFMDLAIVYYYLMDDDSFRGGMIQIQNTHLNMWGISPVELHRQALKNTVRLLPCEIVSMHEMLRQLTGIQTSCPDVSDDPMYVLTNHKKSFGAVYMIFGEVLEDIYDKIGEDYYILPGSVHECILVPVSAEMNEAELQHMVKEINETQVEPEEVLSDSVYRYCHTGKCLCIASKGT